MTPPHSPSRTSGPDGTWDQPRRWWHGWLGVTALVTALAVTGVLIVFLTRPASTRCAEGVERRGPDHSCVGLTDGDFAFSADLEHLFSLIHAENQSVADAGAKPGGTPWVGVVYMMPMVPGQGGTTTQDSVRHELEGAYTAQWEANHHHAHGDSPQIRLLLAHTGGTDDQREYTLRRIEARREADHIVAVVGLGTSTAATRAAIQRLTRQDIAAFGSVLTADDLAGIPGLVRVAPPNSDEAAAAAAYLTKDFPNAKVLLVQDKRGDDLYSRTLGEQFRKSYPRERLVDQAMTYDSSKSDVSTYFTQQMANVCLFKPDVVYFAGRGIDLPRFLAPLSHRHCSDKALTVLSGDDASQVGQTTGVGEVKDALRLGNLKLVYTGLAHPGAWTQRPQSYDPTAIAPFLDGGRFRTTFPRENLDDGQGIMGYDATLTAVSAIRIAATGTDTVTGRSVTQMLTLLYGARSVSGASGLIWLDDSGGPKNKAIPIVELRPDGQVHTVAVSSRTGNPPDARPQGG